MLIIEYFTKIYNYKLIILLFSLSLLCEELINFSIYRNFNISIIEFVFLIVFIYTIINYKKDFVNFILKNSFKNLFYFLFISILIFKILKTYFSNFSQVNVYETIIWFYFFIFVCNTNFLIVKKNYNYDFFNNIFFLVSLLSSVLIFISLILYNSGYDLFFLWEVKEKVFQPYFGANSIHFNGFFSNYNMQAYLLIPGIFCTLNINKLNKIYKNIIIVILLFSLLLTKSKIIILVLSFLFLFISINYLKINLLTRNIFIICYFLTIFIFYSLLTHFLPLSENILIDYDKKIFLHYYTEKPIFNLLYYDFYGSLFYKLKTMAYSLLDSNNYIFFNGTNFKEIPKIFEEYEQGIYPHSEYFGSLSNFGLVGFFMYLIFMYYPLITDKVITNPTIQIYTLIFFVFLIEAIVSDILSHQFLWVIFAILVSCKKLVAEEGFEPPTSRI